MVDGLGTEGTTNEVAGTTTAASINTTNIHWVRRNDDDRIILVSGEPLENLALPKDKKWF